MVALALILAIGAAVAQFIAQARGLTGWSAVLLGGAVAFSVQVINPALSRAINRDMRDLILLAWLRRWSRVRVSLTEFRVRYRFDPLPVDDARFVVGHALGTTLDPSAGKNHWKGDRPHASGYYQADVVFEGTDTAPNAVVLVLRTYGHLAVDIPRIIADAAAIILEAEGRLGDKGQFRREGLPVVTTTLNKPWPNPTEVQSRIDKLRESKASDVEIRTTSQGVRAVGLLGPTTWSDIRDALVLHAPSH